ncbi:nuclear transport factor 2 family protein [Mycolicibacterium frederiksbergense]|uniref:nuclear transport factor 2 family protein n=1 Tax=Mycolicibacterium frederiksbergense TaxID=117567 RepID=UPI00265BC163|nr:nuclear transport factor 2 family protein [Mycolicibacterium frederiksbergense]MBX9918295.1 nuclear transport factor 2 family protein [Mycolicibacterium frederiksbergense]MDO0977653.1 nuclear transport factor 2 family protein [Mycolicibacterium frederiksbergense]
MDDYEAICRLKARYCRFLDTKDYEAWKALFAPDVVVKLDMAISTGGADGQTAPDLHGLDEFVPVVLGGVEHAQTKHHVHTPEIDLTSDTTASAIWAMEDLLLFADGGELFGAGHYHETYEKRDGGWVITSLHLTRTILRFSQAT